MDDWTKRFIEYLPIPQSVSVERAAEILGGKHWVDILLYEIHNGPLMSWTHSSARGNPTIIHYRHGEVAELPCLSLDADTTKVFISDEEVLWRWCMEYERGAQGVNLPERSTVEARQQAVLKLGREKYHPEAEEKPLSTKERNTLLIIIAVLCKEAKHDYTKAAKTASLLCSTGAQMGISIGETTIECHLKKIPDALGSRTR